jgi:hypothetical protein
MTQKVMSIRKNRRGNPKSHTDTNLRNGTTHILLTVIPRENPRPATSHWQTLSHNMRYFIIQLYTLINIKTITMPRCNV